MISVKVKEHKKHKPNISLCGTLTLLSKVWEVKGILKY